MKTLILGATLTAAAFGASAWSAIANPQIEGTGNPTKHTPELLIAPTNPNPPQPIKGGCDLFPQSCRAPICPPNDPNGCGIYDAHLVGKPVSI